MVCDSVNFRIPSAPCRGRSPGFLHASDRRVHRRPGRRIRLIDVDAARRESSAPAEPPVSVRATRCSRSNHTARVGQLHRLLLRGERIYRDHRPERLLRIQLHSRSDPSQNRGLIEQRTRVREAGARLSRSVAPFSRASATCSSHRRAAAARMPAIPSPRNSPRPRRCFSPFVRLRELLQELREDRRSST